MNIKALREEYAKLHTEAGEVISAAATDNRSITAEEKESNEKRYSRMDEINSLVAEQQKHAAMKFAAGEIEIVEPKGKATFEAPRVVSEDRIREGVNEYLRNGVLPEDLYTLISTTSSSVLLPKSLATPDVIRRQNNAFRAALAAYNYAPITGTACDQIVVPIFDDTANTGAALTENASTNTAADVTVSGSLTLNAVVYQAATQWLSNTQILSQSYDILGALQPVLAMRLDKGEEAAWTTTLKTKTTSAVTSATPSTITYANLLSLEHALPAVYRNDAVFILSDDAFRVIRGLVDDQHRPIMDADPQGTFQGRIHGKPVVISDQLDAMGNSKTVGAFVSAGAIKMRQVTPQRLTRYVNVPTFPDQTGFNIFENADCNFVQSGTRLLLTPAS